VNFRRFVTNKETIKTKGPTVEQLSIGIGLGAMTTSDESAPANDLAPADEPAPVDGPAPATRGDESAIPAVPATETVPVDLDALAIYTGRVYLMFDANLKQAVL
jgi:hypothetical protein